MDHVKFALRLLVGLFFVTLVAFWLEAAWDLSHAIDPSTGGALRLSQLRATPAMVRALASSFAGAYNTLIALLLTFISLDIPITANLVGARALRPSAWTPSATRRCDRFREVRFDCEGWKWVAMESSA